MSTRTRWWWVRHAPVTSTEGRIYGNTDPPANVEDPPTYAALARFLPDESTLVTSHLQRTRQTAEAIRAAGLDMPEPTIEEDLAEQNFGEWQGRRREDVYAELDPKHLFWLAPARTRAPGGESFVDMTERVAAVIERLTAQHAGGDIISVGHGGVIRAAIGLALRLDPEIALGCQVDNCSVTRLDHFGPTESHPDGAWALFHVNHIATTESVLAPDHTAMLALLQR
ncbi:MAG: histidine phosphatase family protein [Alphaproteobacteria bacterium]|nr:histidine phosphatase family protein [Alphaproteobacteria bacterium]MCZ6840579.1 histidine phosphatase family protein [Alphaproteobacteria bacterium]